MSTRQNDPIELLALEVKGLKVRTSTTNKVIAQELGTTKGVIDGLLTFSSRRKLLEKVIAHLRGKL